MKIIDLETVGSTNDYAKENSSTLEDGTLVSAMEQTAGRGRCGRKWTSPPGENICASFLMKKISDPFRATLVASLAVLDLLRKNAPEIPFFIKWPNDIYCGCRKICGVLSECVAGKNGKSGAVIAGMGININMPQETLDAIEQPAVSLLSLTGRKYNREKLLSELAESLNRYYIIYNSSAASLFQEWKGKNFIQGKKVQLAEPSGKIRDVQVLDISEDGRLVCRENGEIFLFSSGDVRLVKTPGLFEK